MATKLWAPPKRHEHDLPEAIRHAEEVWRCGDCYGVYRSIIDTHNLAGSGWRWKKVSRIRMWSMGIRPTDQIAVYDGWTSHEKCGHPLCDLHVVRPGKVQCDGYCSNGVEQGTNA